MLNNKDLVLATFQQYGAMSAIELQKNAFNMPDDLLIENPFLPNFFEVKSHLNMIKRPKGFVCVTPAGRVAKLLIPYDSDLHPQNPEEIPEYWYFAWGSIPKYAKPFIPILTNPYNTDDVCVGKDKKIYKSLIDNNIEEPTPQSTKWEIIK